MSAFSNPFGKAAKAKREAAKQKKLEQKQQSRTSTFLQTPAAPIQRSLSNSTGTASSYTPSYNSSKHASSSRRSSASSRSSMRKVPYQNNANSVYADNGALPPPPSYTAAIGAPLQNAIPSNLHAAPSPSPSRRGSADQKVCFFNRTFTAKQSHQTLRRMRSGDGELTAYKMLQQLRKNVQDKQLQRFYTDKALALHAKDLYVKRSCQKLKKSWKLTDEEGCESSILCLWDVCLLIDDSGSMVYYPERKADLKDYVSRITPALTYFDRDGIDLYFMNNIAKDCKEQTDEHTVAALIENMRFQTGTALGNTLLRIVNVVKQKILTGKLDKPVLILILTDGEPFRDGPKKDQHAEAAQLLIEQFIAQTMVWLRQHGYPYATISYQFAQVGNDEKVEKWFKRIDNLKPIGDVIDCTSRYEAESAQAGEDGMTVEEYLLKLLLGAIGDRDKADE